MTHRLSPVTEREIQAVVISLRDAGVEFVSQSRINDTLTLSPASYPAMSALTEKDRKETITRYMSIHFPMWNQTGRNPKSRVWLLSSQGGTCVIA